MSSATLMIQGTTSDAGKSLLVTALCRWLVRKGVRVAPFKPQNMALNSAVTSNGGEIGRAQVVQAQACKLVPHTDMNPVLLKPNTDVSAQVIVHGQSIGNLDACSYHDYKTIAQSAVLDSYARLSDRYDAVIVEGAGSPAEINLRENDIANMGFAEAVNCPVILIADIDRGGVFAHITGTLNLLRKSEQKRVSGFVINRFRGDMSLLQSGLDCLKEHTGKPVFGVLPFLHGLHLEAEDALPLQKIRRVVPNYQRLKVVVPALPRISNHTDFDPLRQHPQVDFHFIGPQEDIPTADLIILPGSKNVRSDLKWLRKQGWESAIYNHLRYRGKLIGICGGYQMLGKYIHDPLGTEAPSGSALGFGFLDMETTLERQKQLRNLRGNLVMDGAEITGYEIHAGKTQGSACEHPAVRFENGYDGACSEDNLIIGTYLHGLFESGAACKSMLTWAGLKNVRTIDYSRIREENIERLADTVEQHLDTNALLNHFLKTI